MSSIGIIASKGGGGGGNYPEGVPSDAIQMDLNPALFGPVNTHGTVSYSDGVWQSVSPSNAKLNIRSLGGWVLAQNIDPLQMWMNIEYTTEGIGRASANNISANKYIPYVSAVTLITSTTQALAENETKSFVYSGSGASLPNTQNISINAGGGGYLITKVRILGAYYK